MLKKFRLRNERQQQLAIVLYFKEEQSSYYNGIIIINDLSKIEKNLYKAETIDQVINDLANRINISYNDYIDVSE